MSKILRRKTTEDDILGLKNAPIINEYDRVSDESVKKLLKFG